MQSLKKDLIFNLACSTSVEGLEDNKLILITAAGIIIGDPIFDDDIALSKFSSEIASSYKQENNIDPNTPTDGSDGFVSLKNVTIKTGGSTSNLPFVNVFFDQVIGVTLGNINTN